MPEEIQNDVVRKSEVPTQSSEVPAGISIGDIRRAMPADTQLIVEFCSSGGEGWDFTLGDKSYGLRANAPYIVGSNPDRLGELYLNSLHGGESGEATSDIPYSLDQYIADANSREQMRVVVRVRSDDLDLQTTLLEIERKNRDIDQYRRFESEFFAEAGRVKAGLEERISEMYPDTEVSGERLEAVFSGVAMDAAYREFIGKAAASESVDWPDVTRGWADECVLQLDAICKKRLPDLKARTTDNREMGVAIDEIRLGDDRGVSVLTIYRPGRGWTVIYPNFNCPQQAAAALMDQVFNSSGKSEFPLLSSDVAVAQETGDLTIDADGRMVIYRQMDKVRPDMAVFHGDGKLEDLIGTLRMAGDPRDGQREFHQIIIGQQEEAELMMGEPITITIEDIEKVRAKK